MLPTYSYSIMKKDISILGVGINNIDLSDILEYLLKNIETKQKKIFLTTINSEILVAAHKKSEYRSILNSSDLALVDGFWVKKAVNLLGFSLKERIAGVDLVHALCKEVSKRPITVGFFGGRGNVAESAAECLKNEYPGLKVAFTIEDWPESEAKSKNLKCDILFVALGHPKQEIWIYNNLPNINVLMAMGVGGAFDFISGRVRRAPKIVQDLGFEWLFRLINQPWRIKRQSSLIYFVLLILQERLRKDVS